MLFTTLVYCFLLYIYGFYVVNFNAIQAGIMSAMLKSIKDEDDDDDDHPTRCRDRRGLNKGASG